jgi:hypothetical protein
MLSEREECDYARQQIPLFDLHERMNLLDECGKPYWNWYHLDGKVERLSASEIITIPRTGGFIRKPKWMPRESAE